MTPKEIAKELYDLYSISYNQHWEAKHYARKTLHVLALVNNMNYRMYYEILKEIEKL